jgi:phospholipid-binding lipoprotein MlaA
VCIPLNLGQAAEFYMQSDDRANDNHGSVYGSLDEDLDLLDDEEVGYDQCDYRIADPVKYWNLAIYHFNDKFYFWVLKPLVKGYIAVTPRIMRTGVQNFFINITTPIRLVNSLLQFKIKPVGTETIRFALNSTVGILGFWDPAENITA